MLCLPLLDPLAAVLLVAKRSQIIGYRINAEPPTISPVVSGSRIVTVDFDRVTSRVFWADAQQKKIWSAYQNGTDRQEVRFPFDVAYSLGRVRSCILPF